jgi:hypothetical protein
MIEQFFDFCRLYPLGRFTRSWNKFFYFDEDSTHDCQWARDYTAENQKGIVLLQRQQYLEGRRKEVIATIQQRGQSDSKVTDSICNELEEIVAKIHQVQEMYLAHEERMRVLWPKFKSNTFSREVLMAQKPQYRLIAGRQPYVWVQTRNQCSDSGGCCGRECACCEKPLKVVIKHGSSLFGPRWKKKTGVYGHCTAECGCCIRFKGCYMPDPWFEKESKPKSTA